MSETSGRIPRGWELTSLGCVTDVSKEKCEPVESNAQYYIGLEHIEGGSNRLLDTGSASDVKSTKSVFKAGDVLYGKLRPYLKKICRPEFDGICSTDILVFPQSSAVDNGFLLHFLSRRETADFATQNANGINLPRISAKSLAEISLKLPPLAEQRRIVAKIEALQERSRKAREALAEVKPLLEQFRQSLLAAAFRGDLTADWREQHPDVEPASELLARIRQERRAKWEQAELAKYEAKGKKPPKGWQEKYKESEPVDDTELPELPEGWFWARLGDIADFINGDRGKNYPNKSEYVPDGLPFINTGHIKRDGSLSLKRMNYISREKFETLGSGKIEEGDLVYCLRGATLGKTAFVDPFNVGAIASSLVIIRPDLPSLREYSYYFLISPFGREEIAKYDNGSAQPNLSANNVTKYLLPVPPAAEISVICNLLKASELRAREIATYIAESESALTQLDQSILAKAFRGELVPQDPNDEPASVLLERIRQQREANKNGQPKRKGRSKAPSPSDEKQRRLGRSQAVLDILLLLEAWGQPVSIAPLEAALVLKRCPELRKSFLKARRQPKQKSAPTSGPLVKGLDAIYAHLVARKVIKRVGRHAYELLDGTKTARATQADRDRAAEAIGALGRLMKVRELDEEQAYHVVAEAIEIPYEIGTAV